MRNRIAEQKCTKNHGGSAGSMESALMHLMHQFEKIMLKYTCYIEDGDECSVIKVLETKQCDDDFVIQKLECASHMQETLSLRLRNLRQNLREKIFSDGWKKIYW